MSSCKRRRALGSLLGSLATVFASSASSAAEPQQHATTSADASDVTTAAGSAASRDDLSGFERVVRPGIPPGSLVWTRWPLFDPYLDRRGFILSGSVVTESLRGSGPTKKEQEGFAFFAGPSIETRRFPFIVRGQLQFGGRLTGGEHLVLAVSRYQLSAGLALGPIEATGRIGVNVADIHFGAGGFGVGFFSPHAGLGVAASAGPLRLAVLGFSEYAWRWFSGEDAVVRGIVIDLAFLNMKTSLPSHFRLAPQDSIQ
jgi:hypothetical protein